MMRSLDKLIASARAWKGWLTRAAPPRPLAESLRAERPLEALGNLTRRIQEGNRAPLRIAIFGPTGAGKSKIFNSLVGEALSPVSFRRPCTRTPVYYIHESRDEIARSLRGDVRIHGRTDWDTTILIDAPDFDSIEAENRALADRIYLEADAFIFVTDVHKYADAATWAYLDRIHGEGKACAFVLNKVLGGDPVEDFRARLEELFGSGRIPGPIIEMADRPQADEELLPRTDPGLEEILRAIEGFQARGTRDELKILVESFRLDLDRFLSEWQRYTEPLIEYRRGVERLGRELDGILAREAAGLEGDIQAEIDATLKDEVYRQVLRRIERIDILRYPRRILALPAVGVKKVLGKVWTRFRPEDAGRWEETAAAEALNLASLEGRLRTFQDDAGKVISAEKACPGILDEETYRALRSSHETVKESYRRRTEEFRAWAREQAQETASRLTTESKVKFILSQVIYNTVVIGVQVKTAGTLTLTEIFTDGVLSPLVAKAVGMAVSSERVAEFERRAREEFARRLVEVLREEKERFQEYLAASVRGIEGLEELAPGIENLRASRERLVESFLGGDG